VHAHLRGLGVEVMASSDNVLRCGLTPKHVDVPELLRITDFRSLTDPREPAAPVPYGIAYRPPVEDFALLRVGPDLPGVALGGGPAIVLCTEGTVNLGELALRPGAAAFVRADAVDPTLEGSGTAFVATPGRGSSKI
jgi:mannose-6-phosphate isomerase